jgi:hypothetical protein
MALTDCLQWFSGKSLEKAQQAIGWVEQSLAQGYWVPKVSRTARAVLSKPNVAKKLFNQNKWLEDLRVKGEEEFFNTGYQLDHAITYGDMDALREVDFAKIYQLRISPKEREVLTQLEPFKAAFLEVWEALAVLDESRPIPEFTYLGVSPTLTATLEALKAEKVTVCPLKFVRKVRFTHEKEMQKYYVSVAVLNWPEGTQHCTSRYQGTPQNQQCEACGHAIKNGYNWVPLILWGKDGVQRSLWTGRDCAQRLYGIKMTGELEIEKVA